MAVDDQLEGQPYQQRPFLVAEAVQTLMVGLDGLGFQFLEGFIVEEAELVGQRLIFADVAEQVEASLG